MALFGPLCPMRHLHIACNNLVSLHPHAPPKVELNFHTMRLAIDSTLPPAELIQDSVKRSSVAHLFQLYHVLGDIASIPRKTPLGWVMAEPASPTSPSAKGVAAASSGTIGVSPQKGDVVELDARLLARDCLRAIGQEMGMGLGNRN